jgi:excisionase family DNA binding protein
MDGRCITVALVPKTGIHTSKMEIFVLTNLMTVPEVATYLGVPVATVYAWNSRGLGPKRFHVGKYVRYRRPDVDTWLDLQVAPASGRAA